MSNFCYSGWPEEENWLLSHIAAPNADLFAAAEPSSCPLQLHGFSSWDMPIERIVEDESVSASRSHSQAEKRRRDRINAHLSTLRKLVPKTEKMDKAALLASVVNHVKDLKRKAMEVSQAFTIPSEVDEVSVEFGYSDHQQDAHNSSKEKNIFINASVCCDDRPELFSELIKTLNGLRLKTVRADVASLGGRTKSILVLCANDGAENVSLSCIKQSLRAVLNRIASSSSTSSSSFRISSRRQRFFLPSNYSQ